MRLLIPFFFVCAFVCVFPDVCVRATPPQAPAVLADSVLLPRVPAEVTAAFLTELTSSWLPGRSFSLLYRGSRDGMTSSAFHRLCDGKGATLTLVRSDSGHTFGAYAGASWNSSGGFVSCGDAFLFSVTGPLRNVVRFPILRGKEASAMVSHPAYGPVFQGGVGIMSAGGASSPFDRSSGCGIGAGIYDDVLRQVRRACLCVSRR